MSVVPLHSGGRPSDLTRERAVRLFQFLREYTLLRAKSNRTTDSYDEVIWLADVPEAPGSSCAARGAGQQDPDVWIEIVQPRLEPPPPPPAALRPWLKPDGLGDSSQDAPPTYEEIQLAGDAEACAALQWVLFDEEPGLRHVLDDYVDRRWRPWAERDRPLRRQQKVYTDLFRLHQSQQRLGEAYEVVMGLGHLSWRTPSGAVVRRHLVVAQTDVRFDANRGVITVVAAVDGAMPALEQDMLEPDERPAADDVERISSMLGEVGDDIFSDESLRDGLRAWQHGASSRGRYEDELERQESTTDEPVVHLAPALILRRRTERSIVQALESIVARLQQEGAYVPEGVTQLVDIVEEDQSDRTQEDDSGSAAEETFFPLPANNEQLDIVRRLRGRPGVLVQGPPGTGKSHTIANLVAHLLAQGQRVLVTSHAARALEVLRDKVPSEVRELAVVVLGNDVSGREELRASVMGIQRRYSSWNKRRSDERVAGLRRNLGAARESEAAALVQLRALREADSYRHPPLPGGYEGTTQQIGAMLRSRVDTHGWIIGRGDPPDDCPLSRGEVSELRNIRHELDATAELELQLVVPDLTSLPSPDVFARIVEDERRAAEASAEVEQYRSHPAYGALRSCPSEARNALWSAAHELAATHNALDQRPEPWVAAAVGQVLLGYSSSWRALEQFTTRTLEAIQPLLALVGHTQVLGTQGHELTAVHGDARQLLEHLRQGHGWGAGPFRAAVVKRAQYIADTVRVDGASCREVGTIERLVRWLEVHIALDGLDAEWSSLLSVPMGSISARAAGYADILAALQGLLFLEPNVLAATVAAANVPSLPGQDWRDPATAVGLAGAAAAADRDAAWTAATTRFAVVERALRSTEAQGDAHPGVGAMLDALLAREVRLYRAASDSLSAVVRRSERGRRRDELITRLQRAAPGVSSALLAEDEYVDARLASLHDAWDWARADRWLRRRADPAEARRLERELDDARHVVERVTRDLAAELAWAHTMGRLTESERMHLVAWQNAVAKIGKGTGKSAPAWRARAREAMEGCRTAVPAWIMPIFKVAETVDIVPEAFDVVIVDEASQSGPEALFLQFLARKMIVVGDDQQISPSNIGIEREKVEVLNSQYMRDIRLGGFFTTENSLFDLAGIRYRDRIMLREHFRCMPEIIQFSNGLCYRDQPLIPLRQFGADRLIPAVRTRHVPEGYVTGSNVNEPEARAIVKQLTACLKDPAYAGKTIGVVSLVGPAQAEHIRRLLVQQVDPSEMERRQIVCGDAYAFQGDERDVMFLSLVQAVRDSRRPAALTREPDKRRFNVAASRARDQMWLFHTATVNDLHPDSVAHHLLDYCLHPGVEATPLRDIGLEELRRRIDRHERGKRPPEPFDSWFEAAVFLHLVDRGYRVIPQYPMADYKIDMVVEGLHGRVAVECDGDVWHGGEAFDRDVFRQRMLERCGMPFMRIRGSTFYRDPEAAMQPLWADLKAQGITLPGEEAAADLYVQSREDIHEVSGEDVAGDEPTVPIAEPVALADADDIPVQTGAWTTPYEVIRLEPPKVRIDIFLPGADADVRRMVQQIVEVEAPIAVELLIRRVRDAWGIGRAGSRVAEAVRHQLDWLRIRGHVRVDDGFVWAVGHELTLVRVPTDDPITVRDVEHVTPFELRESIVKTAERTAPGSRSHLVREVARLFGWRRLGADIARTLDAHVTKLLRDGRLVEEGDQIRWADGGMNASSTESLSRSDSAVPEGTNHDAAPKSSTSQAAEPTPSLPADLDRCMTEREWQRRVAEAKRLEARLDEARREGDTLRTARLSAEVSDLRARLEDSRVLATPIDASRALLGCRVEFRDNDGPPESWLLVPPAEANATDGRLNVATPYGRALYSSQVGDRVEVDGPDSRHVLEVLAVDVD